MSNNSGTPLSPKAYFNPLSYVAGDFLFSVLLRALLGVSGREHLLQTGDAFLLVSVDVDFSDPRRQEAVQILHLESKVLAQFFQFFEVADLRVDEPDHRAEAEQSLGLVLEGGLEQEDLLELNQELDGHDVKHALEADEAVALDAVVEVDQDIGSRGSE